MRIAAVGDLHCRADTRRNVAVALRGVDQEADVLLLADARRRAARDLPLPRRYPPLRAHRSTPAEHGDPWARPPWHLARDDPGRRAGGQRRVAGAAAPGEATRVPDARCLAAPGVRSPGDQGEIVRYRYLSRRRPSFASARASGPTRIIFADVAGSRAAIHLSVWLAQMENMGRLRALSAARHQVT